MGGPDVSVARQDMAESAVDRAKAAIRAGDTATALAQVDEILAENRILHDQYGDMCASFLTYIAQQLGEEAVEDAWRHCARDTWEPAVAALRDAGDPAALAEAFALFLKSHRYEFEVVEDDEAWRFEVGWCSSGERMVLEGKVAGNGGDPGGHHRFGSTKRAYEWSDGRRNFPYYDVHSVVWMRLMPKEWGWPALDIEYGPKDHGEVAIQRYVVFKHV
jgi:hypothetical protein